MICAERIAIIDNGAYRLKYEYSTASSPQSMPNCIAKVNKSMQSFISDEIDQIQNTSQLIFSRPFTRGYLTNWNIEREVHLKYISISFLISLFLSLSLSFCFSL